MPSCPESGKRLVSMLASESGVLYSQWKKTEENHAAHHAINAV